jgi:hypothetical protein
LACRLVVHLARGRHERELREHAGLHAAAAPSAVGPTEGEAIIAPCRPLNLASDPHELGRRILPVEPSVFPVSLRVGFQASRKCFEFWSLVGALPAFSGCRGAGERQKERDHEVSIHMSRTGAVAGYRGARPRAKTSMTNMRPPQHGHGRGDSFESAGGRFSAAVGCGCGAGTLSNSRARAMFCWR